MRRAFCLILFFLAAVEVFAQKYTVSEGFIQFYSQATLEDIKAVNKKINSIFNSQTSDIAFTIPINQFQFQKKLMQEHFNDKYMESHKYPNGTFSGKVRGYDPDKTSVQEVKATGKLTIHGVTQQVEIPGTIERKGNMLLMKAAFIVKLKDYKIKIPQILWQNIAEQVEVTVDLQYKPQ